MLGARRTTSTWLTARTCLRCGYRGNELQGERGLRVVRCPVCEEDLYARRARSYAEMEGLVLDDHEHSEHWWSPRASASAVASGHRETIAPKRSVMDRRMLRLALRIGAGVALCVMLMMIGALLVIVLGDGV